MLHAGALLPALQVAACRTAIKNNNIPALFKIIKDGDSPAI